MLHGLVAPAWFGAMAYSFGVPHPRASRFFGSDEQGFEDLMLHLAAGARWKVLGARGVLAASGAGLATIPWIQHGSPGSLWSGLVLVKTVLFVGTVGVFVYVSWRMWPARLFATSAEIPAHQRRFRRVSVALLGLVGAQIVLGVLAARLT